MSTTLFSAPALAPGLLGSWSAHAAEGVSSLGRAVASWGAQLGELLPAGTVNISATASGKDGNEKGALLSNGEEQPTGTFSTQSADSPQAEDGRTTLDGTIEDDKNAVQINAQATSKEPPRLPSKRGKRKPPDEWNDIVNEWKAATDTTEQIAKNHNISTGHVFRIIRRLVSKEERKRIRPQRSRRIDPNRVARVIDAAIKSKSSLHELSNALGMDQHTVQRYLNKYAPELLNSRVVDKKETLKSQGERWREFFEKMRQDKTSKDSAAP